MRFLERSLDQMNQWWKYVLVCACALFLWPAIGSIPLVVAVWINSFPAGEGMESIVQGNVAGLPVGGLSKNLTLALMLFSTVVTLLLTVPLVKALHKRSFSEVINGTKKIRFGRCLTGVWVWFALMSMMYLADYLINREDYVLQFDLWRFIPLVFVSLVFMPFQTTSEEFLFRGYLTQGFAAWTKRRWASLIFPSLIFGLMHVFNPEVKEFGFWATMPQYVYFGLFFGLVSILDDGIELAIGIHTANNIFLSLFATSGSSVLQTDAVLEVVRINPYKDMALLVVMSIFAGAYFAGKYRWNFLVLLRRL
ncbi:MAG: CPBP family intramembrane metalloprotease [Tannerellaceae bacterium]|nr:CPBP family intramembrane metalloprotease [Tannerellaceae bacterium]